jgi:hypothetical protein
MDGGEQRRRRLSFLDSKAIEEEEEEEEVIKSLQIFSIILHLLFYCPICWSLTTNDHELEFGGFMIRCTKC